MGRCLLGLAGGACGDELGVLRGGAAGGAACLVNQQVPEQALRRLDAEQECWSLPGEKRAGAAGQEMEGDKLGGDHGGGAGGAHDGGEDYGAHHGVVAAVPTGKGCP